MAPPLNATANLAAASGLIQQQFGVDKGSQADGGIAAGPVHTPTTLASSSVVTQLSGLPNLGYLPSATTASNDVRSALGKTSLRPPAFAHLQKPKSAGGGVGGAAPMMSSTPPPPRMAPAPPPPRYANLFDTITFQGATGGTVVWSQDKEKCRAILAQPLLNPGPGRMEQLQTMERAAHVLGLQGSSSVELPTEPKKIVGEKLENVRGIGVIDGGKMSAMLDRITHEVGSKTVHGVVKTLSSEASISNKSMNEVNSTLQQKGMAVKANASNEEIFTDLISRNCTVGSVAKTVSLLSGVPDAATLIVQSKAIDRGNNVPDLCMEYAEGQTLLKQMKSGNLRSCKHEQRGQLLHQLVSLQTLYILIGAQDCHESNIMVDLKGNRCVVKGVDNDIVLSEQVNLNKANAPPELHAITHVGRDMYNGIMALRPHHLARSFLENGRSVNTAEFTAICTRLAILQKHFSGLEAEGKVIDTNEQWQSPDVAKSLSNGNKMIKNLMLE
ncbi:MAG: hypothetical protein LBP65_00130 [Puniceicoccales bacterium]|jgi:hypothetical protein|nr:hypothetical protein [Puniceicoccales bacterium]